MKFIFLPTNIYLTLNHPILYFRLILVGTYINCEIPLQKILYGLDFRESIKQNNKIWDGIFFKLIIEEIRQSILTNAAKFHWGKCLNVGFLSNFFYCQNMLLWRHISSSPVGFFILLFGAWKTPSLFGKIDYHSEMRYT